MKIGRNWFRFFRREVWPRRRQVFLHRNIWASCAVASVVVIALFVLPSGGDFPQITFSTLTTATLAFAGLSYGGAIGAVVLAIGLPAGRLFDSMVLNSTENGAERISVTADGLKSSSGDAVTSDSFHNGFRSTYLDLVFVFQMAAVSQLILAVISILVLVTIGGETIRPHNASPESMIGIAVMAFAGTYATLQLSSSIKALSSLARHRDSYHRVDVLRMHRSS